MRRVIFAPQITAVKTEEGYVRRNSHGCARSNAKTVTSNVSALGREAIPRVQCTASIEILMSPLCPNGRDHDNAAYVPGISNFETKLGLQGVEVSGSYADGDDGTVLGKPVNVHLGIRH